MELEQWIRQIKSLDPMIYEDAYWGERPTGAGVTTRLIAEMKASSDAYTRGKFAELLGEMGDQSAVAPLIEELHHPDRRVHEWALIALDLLGFDEGLAAAEKYREAHPESL
jgi:HEAT repeat protein